MMISAILNVVIIIVGMYCTFNLSSLLMDLSPLNNRYKKIINIGSTVIVMSIMVAVTIFG